VVAAGVLATAAGALPGFLTGALGVQLQGDLGFDAAGLGGAVAGFFAASALGSGPAGVLAERIGPRRTIYVGTIATAVVLIGVAVTVRTWVHLVIALVLAGAFNALIQPAVNALLINDAAEGRRGLAFGIKQSGVPAATLVGGMAVPLLALTVGWRAAYLAGAGVAILAACAVPGSASGGVAPKQAEHEQQQEPRRSRAVLSPWLLLLAIGTGIGSAAGSVLGIFVVPGAVAAGVTPGAAGWLLTAGSLTAISVRVALGRRADRGGGRLPVVARMMALGAIGFALLSLSQPVVLAVGVLLAFASGWGWTGLLNFSIADAHPERAAAATGVTQAGVYTGATLGPAAFGLAASRFDLSISWLLTGVAMLTAAALVGLADRVGRAPAASDR